MLIKLLLGCNSTSTSRSTALTEPFQSLAKSKPKAFLRHAGGRHNHMIESVESNNFPHIYAMQRGSSGLARVTLVGT